MLVRMFSSAPASASKFANKANVRNVAIIAHVDHGKTSLVDCLLQQAGETTGNSALGDRVMDSNPLEKERGITILSKNTSMLWKDADISSDNGADTFKFNIVDTPGHADFGAEVERIMTMVDGVAVSFCFGVFRVLSVLNGISSMRHHLVIHLSA